MNNISISDNDPDGAFSRGGPTSNADHTRSFMDSDSALGICLTIPSLVKHPKSCYPTREEFPLKSATGKDLSEIPKQQEIPDFVSNNDG
jgi:hypothetical protein